MGNADIASLQESILKDYYSDNARKLHRTVDKIFILFRWVFQADKRGI